MGRIKYFKLTLHAKEAVTRTLLDAIHYFLEFPDLSRSGEELRHFHVDVSINGSLHESSSIVNLLIFESKGYGHDEDEVHSEPLYNTRESCKVVLTFNLLKALCTEQYFKLVDRPIRKFFNLKDPHRRDYL